MSTKILTSHKGRKCKYPGCRRILSIYNHEVNCHVHLNRLSEKARWDGSINLTDKASYLFLAKSSPTPTPPGN